MQLLSVSDVIEQYGRALVLVVAPSVLTTSPLNTPSQRDVVALLFTSAGRRQFRQVRETCIVEDGVDVKGAVDGRITRVGGMSSMSVRIFGRIPVVEVEGCRATIAAVDRAVAVVAAVTVAVERL